MSKLLGAIKRRTITFLARREQKRRERYEDIGYSPPGAGVLPVLILAVLYAGYLRLKEVVFR